MADNISSSPLAAWLPDLKQIGTTARNTLPTAMAVGAGGAGLMYLASQLAQYRAEQERRSKAQAGSSDVLTVTLPRKTAAFNPAVIGRALGSLGRKAVTGAKTTGKVIGAAAIPAGLGAGAYQGTKAIIDHDVVGSAGGKLKAIADKMAPINDGAQPSWLWDPAMWMAGGLGGATMGYHAIDSITRARRKQEEQAKLERAKAEYSTLLGQSLMGPKTASADEFPILDGLIRGLTDGLVPNLDKVAANGVTDIIGAPGALGLLAAIVAHQYVYNRETGADAASKQTRIKPPRSIRLVTAPAPMPVEEEEKIAAVDQDAVERLLKEAGFVEEANNFISPTPSTNTVEEPASLKPKIEKIDANTYVIYTANGPITVNADDPQAQALLQDRNRQLGQVMAGVTAIPE